MCSSDLFREQHVLEDRGGEFFFEKDREDPRAFALVDLAGVGLVFVEDQELPGADGQLAVTDTIPFFPVEHRFYRKTADVVGAIALRAECVEDNILFFEPVVMGLFIESGDVMVG